MTLQDVLAGKLGHFATYIVTAPSTLGFCFPSLLKYLHCTVFIRSTSSYFASVSAPPLVFGGLFLLWCNCLIKYLNCIYSWCCQKLF